MSDTRPAPSRPRPEHWVPLAYAVFGVLWITGSDYLLGLLFPSDTQAMVWASAFKGLAFVAITATFFHLALRAAVLHSREAHVATSASRRPGLLQPLLIVFSTAVLVAGVGYALMTFEIDRIREQRGGELERVAELQSRIYDAWLGGHRRALLQAVESPFTATAILNWRTRGDPTLAAQLQSRLDSIRRRNGLDGVALVDPASGATWLASGATPAADAPLQALARRAVSSTRLETGAVRVARSGPGSAPTVDMAAALRDDSSGRGPVAAVLLASARLPALADIPADAGAAPRLVLLDAASPAPAALLGAPPDERARAGLVARAQPAEVRDGRGALLFGVARSVPESTWVVLAWLDEADMLADTRNVARWTGALIMLALSAAIAIVTWAWRTHRSRQELEIDAARQEVEALRQSFALANRYVHDVVALVDSDGRLLQVSDRAVEMFGRPLEDLVGRSIADLVPADVAERALGAIGRIIAVGDRVNEVPVRRADGSVFPAEVSGRRFQAGGRDFVHLVIRDVSERKRAEVERDRALAQLRQQFDAMPVPCTVSSPLLQITDLNPAFERLFGYTREQMLAEGAWLRIAAPDERERMLEFRDRMILRPQPSSGTWHNRTRDGRMLSVRWHNVPLFSADGQYSGMLAMGEDITEAEQAERRVQRQRDLFNLLAQTNHTIIRERDRAGVYRAVVRLAVEQGRFRFAWVGELDADGMLVPVESCGNDQGFVAATRQLRPALLPGGHLPVGDVLRSGRHVVCNDFLTDPLTRVWHDIGRRAGVRSAAALPLRHRGEVVGAIAVFAAEIDFFDDDIVALLDEMGADISFALDNIATADDLAESNRTLEDRVRERTAEAEAARVRAEQADRVKTGFLAMMSHELRTPLNSIIGFTTVLLEGLTGPLGDEQRRQLEIVSQSSRHLLALVNDLLDISRIEAGRLVTEYQPFDAGSVVRRVFDRFEVLARERRLQFELRMPVEPGRMRGDERRFEQIVANLVSNALRYTEAGSVRVHVAAADGRLRVDVEDTGPGIAPDDLPRLFLPFNQIAGARRHHDGTGLGLAISSRLAQALGGELTVKTIVGAGSTFRLALPLDRGDSHDR